MRKLSKHEKTLLLAIFIGILGVINVHYFHIDIINMFNK